MKIINLLGCSITLLSNHDMTCLTSIKYTYLNVGFIVDINDYLKHKRGSNFPLRDAPFLGYKTKPSQDR